MSYLDKVTETWGDLRFMDEDRAKYLRDLIAAENCRNLLEIGFWKGKSSAYFAAILEDLGRGHLTTIDRKKSLALSPGIGEVLAKVGLTHRVTPIFAHRSHTWVMARMLERTPRPQFDFCYFDGGHTWDDTGFGLLLVTMLLRPGGILVVDDLRWSIKSTIARNPKAETMYAAHSANERNARPVMMAWKTIVPYLGYEDMRVVDQFKWGIARKAALCARRAARLRRLAIRRRPGPRRRR